MDIIGAVIEADITIEVAVDIIVVMDKVVTVATGVKVMIIADSKMETTLGATGNAVTGIRTVVADDLTMEIGEVVELQEDVRNWIELDAIHSSSRIELCGWHLVDELMGCSSEVHQDHCCL